MTATVERLNLTPWSATLGFDQCLVRPAPARLLTAAGQGSLDGTGELHAEDPDAQLAQAMTNVEEVLAAGGMQLSDVLRLTVYATDVDACSRTGTC